MQRGSVLISGAGIAGPALAYWLARYDYHVTVVERAPALREGGQAVDFRGPAHLNVLARMGLTDRVREQQTRPSAVSLVNGRGECLARLPAAFMSGELEIVRGDLVRILYEETRDRTDYVFGDSIAAIEQSATGVRVSFEHGAAREVDLVVGADGQRSNVRRLVFGPDERFIRTHGYCVAGFSVPPPHGLGERNTIFSEPGRAASVLVARTDQAACVLFVYATDGAEPERGELAERKRRIVERFRTMGGPVPQLLDALAQASDLYFDTLGTVHLPRYACARSVLLGDAAYGATLGGQGTGLALIGAYVLAGELAVAGGDHRIAFERYESRLRDYATTCQKGGERVGQFFAPRTRAGLWLRDLSYSALSSRPLLPLLHKLVNQAASAFSVPDYVCNGVI